MISMEEFSTILTELLDELPEEFFRQLSGGVIVSERTAIPDYARGEDLFTMGQSDPRKSPCLPSGAENPDALRSHTAGGC